MQVPAPFEYDRATSVDHALTLLERGADQDALIIAGGQSLLPMMKLRLARPGLLIDINDLHDLDYVRQEGSELCIGALTRHRALLDSQLAGRVLPIIWDVERLIADPLVRNRGTLGGSLCQADPGEDLSAVCAALAPQVVIRGREGLRSVAMPAFHKGPYETDVGSSEMLVEVRIPVSTNGGSAYEKVKRKTGDWAAAAVGAAVVLDDGHIAQVGIGLAGVGTLYAGGAAELVRGEEPSDRLFAEAGRLAAEESSPVTDNRGTAEYKRHLAEELVKRALARAAARAAGREAGNAG